MATFVKTISTVDSHTAGECTRLITSGLPPIQGRTLPEKLAYAASCLPWVPGLLMLEPRGHRDMFGAILVPPCDPGADVGLIFVDNQGFEPMCGHGVIGAVTCLLELGVFPMQEPVSALTLDTAAGLVRAWAAVEDSHVVSVTFENAPAFVWARDVALALPGDSQHCAGASITIDIAFGGNFFVLVDAAQLAGLPGGIGQGLAGMGSPLLPENAHELAALGIRILQAANRQLAVRHPDLPHIASIIDLRFYTTPGEPGADSRNVVVLGDHMVDRSPCGTGTCAELALRYARGQLRIGQPWVVESIIGTRFTGLVAAETHVGAGDEARSAVIPHITGSAYITGLHQFVLDPRDPFPQGFALGAGSGNLNTSPTPPEQLLNTGRL